MFGKKMYNKDGSNLAPNFAASKIFIIEIEIISAKMMSSIFRFFMNKINYAKATFPGKQISLS